MKAKLFFTSSNLATLVLVCLFGIIFFNLYQKEADKRSLVVLQENISLEFRATRYPTQTLFNQTMDVDRYQLQIPLRETVELGKVYQVIGSIDERVQSQKEHRISLKVQDITQIQKTAASGYYTIDDLAIVFSHGKREIISTVFSYLPYTHAQLLLGILLGEDTFQGNQFKKDIRENGLSHVVVASGANIAITAAFLHAVIGSNLRYRKRIILTIIVIFLYMLFLGSGPSLLRAFTLFSVLSVTKLMGRPIATLRLFCMTIAILLLFDPFMIYSYSFLLSVSATAGIFFIYPRLSTREDAGERLKTRFEHLQGELIDLFMITLSTQITTLPLLLLFFGKLTLFSLLINVAVVWIVPIIMFFGFFLAISILVQFSFITLILSSVLWLFLEYFIGYINLFSHLPAVFIHSDSTTALVVGGYYLTLSGFCIIRSSRGAKDPLGFFAPPIF